MNLSALYFIILAGSVTVALLVAIFLFETIAAIALPERTVALRWGGRTRGRVGVLIPAHDEEDMLPETIAKIKPQIQHGDWLLVVADNCADRTQPSPAIWGLTFSFAPTLSTGGKVSR